MFTKTSCPPKYRCVVARCGLYMRIQCTGPSCSVPRGVYWITNNALTTRTDNKELRQNNARPRKQSVHDDETKAIQSNLAKIQKREKKSNLVNLSRSPPSRNPTF